MNPWPLPYRQNLKLPPLPAPALLMCGCPVFSKRSFSRPSPAYPKIVSFRSWFQREAWIHEVLKATSNGYFTTTGFQWHAIPIKVDFTKVRQCRIMISQWCFDIWVFGAKAKALLSHWRGHLKPIEISFWNWQKSSICPMFLVLYCGLYFKVLFIRHPIEF